MRTEKQAFRTVFVGELVQLTGLSTGGRDDDLYADAIMARDGLGRPILRGTGLAGALLATLADFELKIPDSISRGGATGPRDEGSAESLWLMHHAHLMTENADTVVRPNVAIHPWTGAAVDSLYFSTEVLPRGTRWRLMIETDDWREGDKEIEQKGQSSASQLLALALQQWTRGHCWLGRAPARGLGWARLENLQVFRLNSQAAGSWPNAENTGAENIAWLNQEAEKTESAVDFLIERGEPRAEKNGQCDIDALLPEGEIKKTRHWQLYKGSIAIGEREDGYGLDSLSTLARDFPVDSDVVKTWFSQDSSFQGAESSVIKPDCVPAWTQNPAGDYEFMVPGSGIRGALRSALSAHMRRAGKNVWAPNGDFGDEPESPADDPLLNLFGSIKHESNLLVSDAWQVDTPEVYLLEQHAEDEFTQGVYASSKFNRPCLISGKFVFYLALRQKSESDESALAKDNEGNNEPASQLPALSGDALKQARAALELANSLGSQRMLPIGGGIWRGHGWVEMKITKVDEIACDEEIKAGHVEETA